MCASKDFNNYKKTLLEIINNEKLELSEDVKNNNIKSLDNIYTSFNNEKNNIEKDLKENITMYKLINDNQELVKKVYENKNEEYKKNMSFEKYCSNVEKLIYNNITHNSKVIINNMLKSGFSLFVIETVKEGINEQLKEKEESIIGEIYSELFKNLNNY